MSAGCPFQLRRRICGACRPLSLHCFSASSLAYHLEAYSAPGQAVLFFPPHPLHRDAGKVMLNYFLGRMPQPGHAVGAVLAHAHSMAITHGSEGKVPFSSSQDTLLDRRPRLVRNSSPRITLPPTSTSMMRPLGCCGAPAGTQDRRFHFQPGSHIFPFQPSPFPSAAANGSNKDMPPP